MHSFFLSTPIYYVNAKPHLGHGYTTIVADAQSRFHRLAGEKTFFLTGTDEHGDKIVQAAEKNGQSPQAYTDHISGLFRALWPKLNISHDYFVRTTAPNHKKIVQEVLQKVYDNGDIYFHEYGGHYCYGCERFYTDKELVDGKCPDHQTEPTYIKEKNYFFRMSKYFDALKKHITTHPEFIQPERYRNEVLAMLEEDLGDLCISRPKSRLTWGIDLPFDKNFVTYVWFDALLNYISSLEYPRGENFTTFWPAAHHLVAKDILKPHAIFWPTMLMSAGIPLYQGLRVHGYWTVNETKMSKSIGNVVEPLAMADTYGLDAFRYFLLREMRFGSDASFSEEALVGRLNADLANDLGNLFSRVLTMTTKYCGGIVPPCEVWTEDDKAIIELGTNALENFQELFPRFKVSRALDALWELIRGLNKYVDTQAPWALYKKGETQRLGTVLYVLLEGMRKVAIHLWPVMPDACETMLAQLGQTLDLQVVDLAGETSHWNGLTSGTKVAAASNLFPRQEWPAADQQAVPGKPATPPRAEEATIEFGDFQKIDLRVGRVIKAEPVPKTDKLLCMRIDLGEDTPRQIVGGLAEYWKPEDLVGREVVVVANLKPRKLRGVTSQGMVLAVRTEQDLALLGPGQDVPAGSKVS